MKIINKLTCNTVQYIVVNLLVSVLNVVPAATPYPFRLQLARPVSPATPAASKLTVPDR